MAKSVDWYYHRNGCVTCGRSQGFLEANGVKPKEVTSANKIRYEDDAALEIAKEASKIIVSRGKKVETFDMKKNPPSDADLLKAIMGPSGKLRAPALRKGKTLYIGFNEDAYAGLLK
ncbi:MAG TPA: ArsC family (seleno)protein [Phycisphaerae bacterium]|nr:ArsC family (seleno)protein [Phycisphaerae bacterium]HRW52135.1 ArsC family (seleno)protein [Phycisphaerae bacterium]